MLSLQDAEFRTLVQYIRDNFGINLTQKRNLIEGRLGNHLQDNGFSDYASYIDHVLADRSGNELANLLNRLTTNHTYFLREPAHFDYIRQHVLPSLEKNLPAKEIRSWSAGCSSGEEPYSLAMLMHEHFGLDKRNWDTRILATDISQKVLEKARLGHYEAAIAENMPSGWVKRYFTPTAAGDLAVIDRIKDDVVFRSLNLIQETFPLKAKFHIIFCRNVMIYFDKETKLELVRKLYEQTEPGGYLFIGHAETIPRDETDYTYIQPAVFQKQA